MKKIFIISFSIITVILVAGFALNGKREFKEIKIFDMPEARQGVAVDKNFIYVIGSQEIGKYKKISGELVKKWTQDENGKLIHLDSGLIYKGKLYCAHSNYPGIPMTSSIEIWDAKTLTHIDSKSLGISWGSCTWVDRYKGSWWVAFAHYDKWKEEAKTDVRWTTVVQFNDNWQMLESWVFPEEVLKKFGIMSNSGGSWGTDGLLYCTGHDNAELYALKLPEMGSILELVDTVPINNTGQGIAWDRSDPNSIYTIRKSDRKVIHSKLVSYP